jgi:hypothetical protein
MTREEARLLLDRLDSFASDTSLRIEWDLERAIDTMESLRDMGYPIAELVKRYRSSQSEYILASLAFFVAGHAGEGIGLDQTSPILLLIERATEVRQPVVLHSCLSALHREITMCENASDILPPTACEFVLRALEFSGDQAWVVYTTALDLLQALCSRDTLRSSFSETQIESLKSAVARIRDFKAVDLREDAETVLQCLSGPD